VLHDNARFHHFVVKVVTFARSFADAAEYRHAAVRFRDVVDELHDRNRLADACAAEEADFTALRVGAEKIDDFNARDQLFGFRRLFSEGGRSAVDRPARLVLQLRAFVDDVADDVHDAAQNFRTDRNGDGIARVDDFRTACQTVGHVHRDAAHCVFAKVLRDFENEALAIIVGFQRVQNAGDIALIELYVHDRAENLEDPAFCAGCASCCFFRCHFSFSFF
jgi:hypothetical protein